MTALGEVIEILQDVNLSEKCDLIVDDDLVVWIWEEEIKGDGGGESALEAPQLVE